MAVRQAILRGAVLGLGAVCLSACAITPEEPQSSSTRYPAKIAREEMVGRWGIASYRDPKDKSRVEAQARAACRNPYTIALGPTDGVMMHVADDPKLYELTLKSNAAGQTFLGFESPPGDWQDREVLEFTPNRFEMRFVDADANNRYGTLIYTRCT
jgi:hypothetical protein